MTAGFYSEDVIDIHFDSISYSFILHEKRKQYNSSVKLVFHSYTPHTTFILGVRYHDSWWIIDQESQEIAVFSRIILHNEENLFNKKCVWKTFLFFCSRLFVSETNNYLTNLCFVPFFDHFIQLWLVWCFFKISLYF